MVPWSSPVVFPKREGFSPRGQIFLNFTTSFRSIEGSGFPVPRKFHRRSLKSTQCPIPTVCAPASKQQSQIHWFFYEYFCTQLCLRILNNIVNLYKKSAEPCDPDSKAHHKPLKREHSELLNLNLIICEKFASQSRLYHNRFTINRSFQLPLQKRRP